MAMQTSRLILCEKSGQWALALRRTLDGTGIRVYETRSRQECLEELEQSPASLVGLELATGNVSDVYRFIGQVTERFPATRVVVVGREGTDCFEWEMREVGAIHAIFSLRQIAAVAKLAHRHLSSVDVPELPLRESIRARLPWGD